MASESWWFAMERCGRDMIFDGTESTHTVASGKLRFNLAFHARGNVHWLQTQAIFWHDVFLIASLFACFDDFIPAFACFCHVSVPSWPDPRASTRSKDTFQRRVTWQQRSECDWKLTYDSIHMYDECIFHLKVTADHRCKDSVRNKSEVERGPRILKRWHSWCGRCESRSGDLLGPDLTDAGVCVGNPVVHPLPSGLVDFFHPSPLKGATEQPGKEQAREAKKRIAGWPSASIG